MSEAGCVLLKSKGESGTDQTPWTSPNPMQASGFSYVWTGVWTGVKLAMGKNNIKR